MNPAAQSLESNEAPPVRQIRGPEIGPALKRDRLLQRVRAARSKLSPAAGTAPKLR
jgi:hypothetical protein